MFKIKITLIVTVLTCMITGTTYAQGCMEATSDEGVSVVGFFQPQFEYQQGENENANSFTFNRARVGFIGSIPYDVGYYMFIETSAFKKENPFLLDAFVSYSRLSPYANFSIGQFKSPFSLEWNTPCSGLHTINRSKVVNTLSGGRDIGLMVSGGSDTSLVKYSLGLMNGLGIGTRDDNTGKDIVGRIVVSPIEFVKIGGSFRYGKSKPAVADADEDEKTRLSGEIQVKYENFLLQAEYIYGEDVGSYTTGGGCGEADEIHEGTVKRNGLFIQAMYMTKWNLQPVIKYESWEPDMDAEDDLEQITTFGINYFLNDWTRIQINYLYCAEGDTGYNEIDNDQVLVQIQVKF